MFIVGLDQFDIERQMRRTTDVEDVISFNQLVGEFTNVVFTPDGDALPPIAWLEDHGVDYEESRAWMIEQLRMFLIEKETECAELSTLELLLEAGVWLGQQSLVMGLRMGAAGHLNGRVGYAEAA
jgi:hypothetical protein